MFVDDCIDDEYLPKSCWMNDLSMNGYSKQIFFDSATMTEGKYWVDGQIIISLKLGSTCPFFILKGARQKSFENYENSDNKIIF